LASRPFRIAGERDARTPVEHSVVERDAERYADGEHRAHGDGRNEAGLPVSHRADAPLPNGINRSAALGRSAASIVRAVPRPMATESNAARVRSSGLDVAATLATMGSGASFGDARITMMSATLAATAPARMWRDHRAACSHQASGTTPGPGYAMPCPAMG
jgi:hypothetical protein